MMNSDLTDEQKEILFNKATEAPFSGALLKEKRSGRYVCVNCGEELFASDAKFDSGSGWPSFSEPANLNHVTLTTDTSHGMIRTEVTCTHCGGHLGHIFDDGPADKGGQRYCINSLCLNFKADDGKQ
jgi:peptide-methionine (R)-S-oxide reductase